MAIHGDIDREDLGQTALLLLYRICKLLAKENIQLIEHPDSYTRAI